MQELKFGGIILGILDTPPPYSVGTVTIECGETLLLFTDGVSEAMNSEDVEFGDAMTGATLRTTAHLPAASAVGKFIQTVQYHAGSAPQSDDITLAVIKRL
jgi:sigma-B regulation protein RsbU (phosphoserine phosphatase)